MSDIYLAQMLKVAITALAEIRETKDSLLSPDSDQKMLHKHQKLARRALHIIQLHRDAQRANLAQETVDAVAGVVQMQDGDIMVFDGTIDVMFHKCCGCGLVHRLDIETEDAEERYDGGSAGFDSVNVAWTRLDAMPESFNGEIVSASPVKRRK